MLPGTIMHLPAVALLAFANVTLPSLDSAEEAGAPRRPSALQPAGRWSTASWEPCSNPCGAGEEQRSVSCVLEDAESTLIVVTDSFCAPPRPTSVRPCYQYRSECANTWVTGDWGQCSAKCGGGQRSRVVECHAGAGAGRAGAGDGVPDAPPAPLPPAQCVPQLRPAERRDCNLQPCPDGRRVWLRISGDSRPRRIRLFSKFTLRCPFHVYWTPADDRSKRKYAWFKDGRRLPLHEDKYTQTDGRGELRVKGADEPDSGEYTCASTTANPQGRTHNFTVKLERVPGDPKPTTPSPQTEEDVDDNDISAETSPEHEDEDAAQETRDDNPTDPAVPAAPAAATEATTTTAGNDSLVEEAPVVEVTDNALPSLPASVPAESVKDTGVIASTGQRQDDRSTESTGLTTSGAGVSLETEPLPVEQRLARRKREPEAVTAEAPDGDGGARGAEAPEEAKVSGAHGQGAPEEEKDDDDDDDDENGDDRAEDTSSSGGGAITVVAARYDASPFSSCSAPCGPSGLRQRAVRCVDNESGAQLPLAACEDLGPPPPPQEVCNHVDCPPAWEWPPWTGIKCSRACGGGDKWRQARCSQRLADGQDVTLEASRCAHLGPGEERRGCHRAACRSRLRQGELLRLDCLAANATWRHNGSALDVRQDDKYLADHDSGMLLVYSVEPRDAGQYLCDEEDGGVKSTHRFEVTVLPPTTPFSGDDDLFVRVWDVTTENGEFTTEAAPALTRAETTVGEVDGGVDGVEDVEELQTTAPAPGPPFPWHRLFGPAAPLRGRVIGIFS